MVDGRAMDRIPLTGPFKMSEALRRTFKVVFSELRTLLPLVLLVHLPVLLLAAGLVVWLRDDPERYVEVQAIFSLLQFPVSMAAQTVAVGAVIPAVFARLRGQHVAPGEALRHALRRLLPLLGLGISVGLAVWIGSMMCLAPGLIVLCATYVATPALMVEHTGVEASWRRSFHLTAGYRMEVFGVVFVLGMVGGVFAFGAAFFDMGLVSGGPTLGTIAASQALTQVAALVATLLTAVAATVTYHDLRVTKEGISEDELLEVFA